MRRQITAAVLCVVLGVGAVLFSACDNEATPVFSEQSATEAAAETPSAPQYESLIQLGDDLPVSRAMVAKMLALAYADRPVIDAMDREIAFTDVAPEAWYDRFVNACVQLGLMSGGEGAFWPESPLTLQQAQALLDNLNPQNPIRLQITDADANKPISYALWADFYIQALEALSGGDMGGRYGVAVDKTVILAAPESHDVLPEGHVMTEMGPMACAGLHMGAYLDKEVQVLRKGDDIIAVIGITNEQPTLQAAYIAKRGDRNITVFAGGIERTYLFDDGLLAMEDAPVDSLCDIQIANGRMLAIEVYTEEISGVLKSMASRQIELKETGILPSVENIKVYSTADGVPKWKSQHALTVGTDIARFVLKNGVVTAAVIAKTPTPDHIRVVLSATGFGGYVHDTVEITANTSFTMQYGGETKVFEAGESLQISPLHNSDLFGQNRIYVIPADGGRLEVRSIQRSWPTGLSPSYRGILEIAKGESGGYILVNELSLEEYLYSVVPSEMPSVHGVEASMVQAITARSYAYNQLYANRYYQYGANVDDSVNCQVYNNIPENEVSVQAVNATKGQCLSYRDAVISANYFSTSAGVTASAGDVWADAAQQFPGETVSYLQSVKQTTEGEHGDLSTEEAAAAFFKDWNIQSYDSEFSWFRWNVTMSTEALGASINRSLKARYAANPQMIKTLQADGTYVPRPIESIGVLQGIEPVSRGKGGNLTCLRVIGSEATILVYTEYNIRMLLAPTSPSAEGVNIILARKDGTTVTNYALMPSAFFTMDMMNNQDGTLAAVLFHGGGNGHGVGMSQNGVKGMIDAGFGSAEILRHYYPGSEIMKIYE